MHECWDCGTYCDCDGEDLDQPCPIPHHCINPECDEADEMFDAEQEQPTPETKP